MSRKPKQRRMPTEPKVESWAQPSSGKPPIDQLTALREENQKLKIERTGFISEIEELKTEIARLKAEGENLRAAVAALPLPPPPSPPEKPKTEAEQALDDLTQETKPSKGRAGQRFAKVDEACRKYPDAARRLDGALAARDRSEIERLWDWLEARG